jgi:hypothetical protein
MSVRTVPALGNDKPSTVSRPAADPRLAARLLPAEAGVAGEHDGLGSAVDMKLGEYG